MKAEELASRDENISLLHVSCLQDIFMLKKTVMLYPITKDEMGEMEKLTLKIFII